MCCARRGGPRTQSTTTDANLDCASVENALFLQQSLILKSQLNRIMLVTRPVAHQHSENRGFEPSGFELGKTSLAFESPTTFETPFFNRLRQSSNEKDESFTSPGQELGFGATQDRHQQPRPSFENVGGYQRDGGSSDGGNISRKQLFAPSHTATSAHRAANEETHFGHSPQTAPQVGGEQQSGQFSRSGH